MIRQRIAHIAATAFALTACAKAVEAPRCSLDASEPPAGAQPSQLAPACISLIPTGDLTAAGVAELHRVRSSPFTVSVDASGHHLLQLSIQLRGLPDPRSLGPFTTYVAWAATPSLNEEVKLGEVGNGRTAAGVVGLNQFIVIISAETSASAPKRSGRVVMNGTSPSSMLQPHDVVPITAGSSAQHQHGSSGWVMPPMHPHVPAMIPGIDGLIPGVAPWWPKPPPNATTIPDVRPREVLALRDGDSISLSAGLVQRALAGRTITMYGFNGQSPGPLIRVEQQATVVVNFTNQLDQPTSVHWHGIRLDNRFDGTPHVTQELVPPGGNFRYVVTFPDAGIYWYHPHHREDSQQDLGLYGNLFVRSRDSGYYNPVDREEVLILDDFLLDEKGAPVPYGVDAATHALMGRFGNVFLVNGTPDYALRVARGDVVRFMLTNASNTRVFNVSLAGARMKLVGGDLGLLEREVWVTNVVLGPAERYIVEARFDSSGRVPFVNHVQGVDRFRGVFFDDVDTLGVVTVGESVGASSVASQFETLRTNSSVSREIARFPTGIDRAPDHIVRLTLETTPTFPLALEQVLRAEGWIGNPVEWAGTMPMTDWLSTSRDVRWIVRDSATGRENIDIAWRFHIGDVVRIRFVNDARILHPMQHPIHIHGQRFLVLAVDGDPMENRVWKDTVLIPAGSVVDLLVEMTNPGKWMLHCHIAEHLESGMHTVFEVLR